MHEVFFLACDRYCYIITIFCNMYQLLKENSTQSDDYFLIIFIYVENIDMYKCLFLFSFRGRPLCKVVMSQRQTSCVNWQT